MFRLLYRCLLRLHPRRFRERFAEEMLCIFDEAAASRGAPALLGDSFLSLVRQWAFRPAWPAPAGAAAAPGSDGMPVFYTCGNSMPRPGALLNGMILSVAAFGVVSFAIGNWGRPQLRPLAMAGVRARPAQASSATPVSSPGNQVSEAWTKLASMFSASTPPADVSDASRTRTSVLQAVESEVLPVLGALDADHDGSISAVEIARAASALEALDKNHDGKVTPGEWSKGAGSVSRSVAPGTEPLPASHPANRSAACVHLFAVLIALDADLDGRISAEEMRNAPAALNTLDRNKDGMLSAAEVLPDAVCGQ